jgi:hypothetical protein
MSNYFVEPEYVQNVTQNEIEEYLEYSNEKLVQSLECLMSLTKYKENNFTSLIKNIIVNFKKYKKLTEKQRTILAKHLAYSEI